jgi:phage shock protein C
MNTSRRLTRSNTDRIIAGVAGGIANYLNVDPTLIRLGFVLLVLVGGVSPFIYLILWAVLPSEQWANQPLGQQVRENIAEIERRATELANQVGGQVSQLIGNNQGNTHQSTQTTSSNTSNQQNEGPATGPTTRL